MTDDKPQQPGQRYNPAGNKQPEPEQAKAPEQPQPGPEPSELAKANGKGLLQVAVRMYWNLIRSTELANLVNRLPEGSPGYLAADIYRTTIVFLHATFEDMVRGVAQVVLPNLDTESWKNIPFPSYSDDKGPMSLSVANLSLYHKGKRVDDLVRESIDADLSELTISNCTRLTNTLVRLKLDPEPFKKFFDDLGWLMDRRHKIVHEGDLLKTPTLAQMRPFTDSDIGHFTTIFVTVRDFGSQLLGSVQPQAVLISETRILEALEQKLQEAQSDNSSWGDEPSKGV